MDHYVLVSVVLFFASFTFGTAGFGFALVSVPLLSLVATPKLVVPLAVVYGFAINFFLFLRFRQHIDWPKLWPLVVGIAPGVPVGIYTLKHAEDVVIRKLLGSVIIVYALWGLLMRAERRYAVSRFWGLLAGFGGGLLGGASAMSGPPAIIYVSLNQWDKNLSRATLQSYFLITGAFLILGLAIEEILTFRVLRFSLLYLPPTALGGMMGYWVFKKISTRLFHRVILFLLLLIGILLMFS
jgi:uncharacterized membrane protein YfcA